MEAFQEQLGSLQGQLEALLQKIEKETGMSPALAIGVACVLAYVLLRLLWPRPSLKPPPRSSPGAEHPKSLQLGEITLEELAQYDGSDPEKPICVAVKGIVFNVSRGKHLYGPDGGYSCFAGKDASRALAKMSMDPADAVGDLTGLSQSELDSLNEWETQYQFKYDAVGTLAPTTARSPAVAGE